VLLDGEGGVEEHLVVGEATALPLFRVRIDPAGLVVQHPDPTFNLLRAPGPPFLRLKLAIVTLKTGAPKVMFVKSDKNEAVSSHLEAIAIDHGADVVVDQVRPIAKLLGAPDTDPVINRWPIYKPTANDLSHKKLP
jgi:hypothetical protein